MTTFADNDTITIKQSGVVHITKQVPSWVWKCEKCGWIGLGHTSESGALAEAASHMWDDHGVAICAPIDNKKQWGHPGHQWKHVKGTDSIDQCDRCKDMIGK